MYYKYLLVLLLSFPLILGSFWCGFFCPF
ncbi:4Fe-4S binding protein [Polynucleobacter sp. MWH-Jannik1A5]|nr:4Fe-4S binding protein [Polynucleobacter sp. MWH-Jannik1A5]